MKSGKNPSGVTGVREPSKGGFRARHVAYHARRPAEIPILPLMPL